ncbi:MAG: hypothetical protein IT291_10695 [Deltaproteobacteria bacterium]|nr:hypothetical protein [Deltaproteobacteria bacterium]
MAMEIERATLSEARNGSGLLFNAEAAALIGQYEDELSAYRARKNWVEILHSYFLLETGRDYKMSIDSAALETHHLLICNFSSACGRYALWRLMHDQAPEAEQQLVNASARRKKTQPSTNSKLHSVTKKAAPTPVVISGTQLNSLSNAKLKNKNSSILLKFFRKLTT